MTLENNPLECGLDRFFKLGKSAEYMSRDALDKIAAQGVTKRMVHLKIGGDKLTAPRSTWDVKNENGDVVGILTSIAYSSKFQANLAFATVDAAFGNQGTNPRRGCQRRRTPRRGCLRPEVAIIDIRTPLLPRSTCSDSVGWISAAHPPPTWRRSQ